MGQRSRLQPKTPSSSTSASLHASLSWQTLQAMLIATPSIALVAGAVTLDMVRARSKATEVPRRTTDLEATAPSVVIILVVLGASLHRGSPMAGVGRARGLLNTSEGKTTLILLIQKKKKKKKKKYPGVKPLL